MTTGSDGTAKRELGVSLKPSSNKRTRVATAPLTSAAANAQPTRKSCSPPSPHPPAAGLRCATQPPIALGAPPPWASTGQQGCTCVHGSSSRRRLKRVAVSGCAISSQGRHLLYGRVWACVGVRDLLRARCNTRWCGPSTRLMAASSAPPPPPAHSHGFQGELAASDAVHREAQHALEGTRLQARPKGERPACVRACWGGCAACS